MKILVTGAAGFIGFYVSTALLKRGETVVGVDNINDYYDPQLKLDRLSQLKKESGFSFCKIDISDRSAMEKLFAVEKPDKVIHLAAQAGVRYSLENPYAYIQANIVGHLNILEGCRNTDSVKRLVYASSSSVYGGNKKQPFSIEDNVDNPVSLYAATKKSDELMTHCYSHLYNIEAIGLRFFTVYGPWGRPDMAYFSFTNKILNGESIPVFNHGKMKRDFTYIDDIVLGILASLDKDISFTENEPKHKVFNLGNNRSENLMDYIKEIENCLGVTAEKTMLPMQDGDVVETSADISASSKELGFQPSTPISQGIPQFIDWYKDYYKIA